MNYKE